MSRLFIHSFVQAQINENIKAPRYWPLWGEVADNRWISWTKGQGRWKGFYLMASSWISATYLFPWELLKRITKHGNNDFGYYSTIITWNPRDFCSKKVSHVSCFKPSDIAVKIIYIYDNIYTSDTLSVFVESFFNCSPTDRACMNLYHMQWLYWYYCSVWICVMQIWLVSNHNQHCCAYVTHKVCPMPYL